MMKKIILLCLLFPLLSFQGIKEEINILGKWTSEHENLGYIHFDKEGYVTIESKGITVGGKENSRADQKSSMTYTVDTSKDPVHIDFVMTMTGSNKQMEIRMIAKFIDEDTMVIASDFTPVRPTEFNPDISTTMHRSK